MYCQVTPSLQERGQQYQVLDFHAFHQVDWILPQQDGALKEMARSGAHIELACAENGVSSGSAQSTAATTNTLNFPSPHRLLTGYTAAQLALRYGFPVVTQPANNYIAIIELVIPEGSGWSKDDLKAYCDQVRIPQAPSLPF